MQVDKCVLLVQFYPVEPGYWGSLLAWSFGWIGGKTDFWRVHVAIRLVTPPNCDCTYGLTPAGLFINNELRPPSQILRCDDIDQISDTLERIKFLYSESVNYGIAALILARFGAGRYGYTCASFVYYCLTGQYRPNIGTKEVYRLIHKRPGWREVLRDIAY